MCDQVLGIRPMQAVRKEVGGGGKVWGDKPSPTGSWYSGPGGRETRALLCDSILGAAMAPVVVFGYAVSFGAGYRGGEGRAL